MVGAIVLLVTGGAGAAITGGLGFTTSNQAVHLVEVFGMGTSQPDSLVATQEVEVDVTGPGGFIAGPFSTLTHVPGGSSGGGFRVLVFGAAIRRPLNAFSEFGIRSGLGLGGNDGGRQAGVFELLLALMVPQIPGAMIQVTSLVLISHGPASGSYPGFIVNQTLRVGIAARIGSGASR